MPAAAPSSRPLEEDRRGDLRSARRRDRDAMEAFEVLARSDLYNVYTVAPERKPLTLNPGPSLGGSSIDFVPHFSFADYGAQIGRA
jgi:hypothetical protein